MPSGLCVSCVFAMTTKWAGSVSFPSFFFGPAASIGLFVYKKRAERVIIAADWPASSASISSIADPITARFYRDNELLLALASQYRK